MLVRRLLSHGPDVTPSRSYPRAMILNRIRAAADAPLASDSQRPSRNTASARQLIQPRAFGRRQFHAASSLPATAHTAGSASTPKHDTRLRRSRPIRDGRASAGSVVLMAVWTANGGCVVHLSRGCSPRHQNRLRRCSCSRPRPAAPRGRGSSKALSRRCEPILEEPVGVLL